MTAGAMAIGEERAHLVDGAPDHLQVGGGRWLMLG
jgi:hypothetical protein